MKCFPYTVVLPYMGTVFSFPQHFPIEYIPNDDILILSLNKHNCSLSPFLCGIIGTLNEMPLTGMIFLVQTHEKWRSFMGVNREIEKVLLNLDDHYYEKGMSKLSVSVKGIRKDKITRMSRKVVISRLLGSKQNEKFVRQFLENIKEDLEIFGNDPYVQQLLEHPEHTDGLDEKCSMERLYLYLLSLKEEKYQKLMGYLITQISDEQPLKQQKEKQDEKKQSVETDGAENETYKLKAEEYAREIQKLKDISKQRKEKIKELEIKNSAINEENSKLKNKNQTLVRQMNEILKEKQELEHRIEDLKKEELPKSIVVIDEDKLVNTKDCDAVVMLAGEYISKEDARRKQFEKVLVYQSNLQIGELRKIRDLSGNTAIRFESRKEIEEYLNNI